MSLLDLSHMSIVLSLSFCGTICHDRDLEISCDVQDFGREPASSEKHRSLLLRAHQKELCNAFAMREIREYLRRVGSLQDSCFDAEVSSEVEMALHGLAFIVRQASQVIGG